MTARILTLHSRRQKPPGQVGPVAAALEHPAVLDGGDDGPLLAVQCFLRLRDIFRHSAASCTPSSTTLKA